MATSPSVHTYHQLLTSNNSKEEVGGVQFKSVSLHPVTCQRSD